MHAVHLLQEPVYVMLKEYLPGAKAVACNELQASPSRLFSALFPTLQCQGGGLQQLQLLQGCTKPALGTAEAYRKESNSSNTRLCLRCSSI